VLANDPAMTTATTPDDQQSIDLQRRSDLRIAGTPK
jgi:hypothetical protein